LIEWQNFHKEFYPGSHVSIWDALMPAHLADLNIYKDQPSAPITDFHAKVFARKNFCVKLITVNF
jgi:hypothetical protein